MYWGEAHSALPGSGSGQAPAPMYAGAKPTGAPVTATVPVTVPGPLSQPLLPELPLLPPEDPELPEQHEPDELEDPRVVGGVEEPLEPDEPELPQVMLPSNRLASAPSPIPEATWGSTVTSSTNPATAINTSRICLRHRAIATPPLPADAGASARSERYRRT